MRFEITIETPSHLDRPRIPMAQTLRDVADVIEPMNHIDNGVLTDRLTGETKASWTVTAHQVK